MTVPPPNNNVHIEKCYEEGTAYTGRTIREYIKSNAKECQECCKKMKERKCKFWTFDYENKCCYLKNHRGKRKPNLKNISGKKNCEPPLR